MKTKKRKIAIKEASEILLLFKRISRSISSLIASPLGQ